jgi:hypothetical protein
VTNPTRPHGENVLIRIKSGVRLRLRDVVAVIINRPINVSPHSSFTASVIKFDFTTTNNRVRLVKVDNKIESRLFCNLVSKSSVTGSSLSHQLDDYLSLAHFGSVAREAISVRSNLKLVYQFYNYQSKMQTDYESVLKKIEEVFTIPLDELRVPLGQFDRSVYQRLVVFIGAQTCAPSVVVDLDEIDALNDTNFLETLFSLLEQKSCIFVSRSEKLLDQLKARFDIYSIEQFDLSSLDNGSFADSTENPLDVEKDLTVGFEEIFDESEASDLPLSTFNPLTVGSGFLSGLCLDSVRINGVLTSNKFSEVNKVVPSYIVKKSDFVSVSCRLNLSDQPIHSDLIFVIKPGSASQLELPIEFDIGRFPLHQDILINLELSLIDLNSELLGIGILLRDSISMSTIGRMKKLVLLQIQNPDNSLLTVKSLVKSMSVTDAHQLINPS